MIKINETQKILKTLKPAPIIQTPEQFQKNYEFALNLKRDSNNKAGYSGIEAQDCYVYEIKSQ